MSNATKGSRKLAALHQGGLLLLSGLLVCLFAAIVLFHGADGKTDPQGVDLLFKLYAIYAAGLTGKATAFMWGNAKEHEHAARALASAHASAVPITVSGGGA